MADTTLGEWGSVGATCHGRRDATEQGAARPSTHGNNADGVHGRLHDNENVTITNDDDEWLANYGRGRTWQSTKYALARGNAAAIVGGGSGVVLGYLFLYWLRMLIKG